MLATAPPTALITNSTYSQPGTNGSTPAIGSDMSPREASSTPSAASTNAIAPLLANTVQNTRDARVALGR